MDGTKQAFTEQRKVLIVEPEQSLARELQDIIEKLGAIVVGSASCADEPLAILADGAVDAVLLDTDLRREELSMLAASCRSHRIPFALITTYGGFEFRDPALETAPRLYKPLDGCSVRTIVTRALHDRLACTSFLSGP